ncbi:MAG TPA: EAL domain-containing protein [Candidatus Solibacter sp.]|jgi:EAL domain-containing protein (putative c-di-GMP-specific phosphodiesterase class I)/CheY-like chemotaxis protein|nr:EAL domain-containing protein [Candidatus Solibacter sp.]
MTDIKVLIAEDEPLVAKSLSRLIDLTTGFELVGIAENVDQALAIVASKPVDVVISDVRMPAGGGLRLVKEFRARSPLTRVLAYSAYSDDRTVTEMLEAGAIGYVVKNGRNAELLEGLRRAAANEASITGPAADSLLRKMREKGSSPARVAPPESAAAATAHIQSAFGPGSLSTVFQPIVSLADRSLVGAEALSRFSASPRQGPDQWFAEATRAGLLIEADCAALKTAINASKDLPKGLFASCNATPELVLSGSLQECIQGHDVSALVIEITERAPINDYSAFARALAPLRNAGGRIAIDDTGSGFASLRHILRLEPDIIKLDRDLCQGINADPARIALASGLASFAFGIGASIIAEGIETQAELDVLTALGVQMGQGYLLGRPEPLSHGWPAAM